MGNQKLTPHNIKNNELYQKVMSQIKGNSRKNIRKFKPFSVVCATKLFV